MNITFLIPNDDFSGGIRVVAIYAERLQTRGHKVTVLARPRPMGNWKSRIKSTIKRVFIKSYKQPSYFSSGKANLTTVPGCGPLSAGEVPDADVIVSTWWETAEWSMRLPDSKGAKALFIQGYEIDHGWATDRLRATWRLPIHKIVVSSWLAGIAANQYGDSDTSLVPNGVDSEHFVNRQPSGRGKVIGFVYSSAGFRGADIAIKAYTLAKQSIPELQLVAFGVMPPAKSDECPIGSKFVVQPSQEQIPSIYSSCRAWLFPSRREGFGLPILEAMACGTPVIATTAGAAPEILASGGGQLVASESAEAMAGAIVKYALMSEDEWRLESLEARAIAESYSWDDATSKLERALHKACDQNLNQTEATSM